MKIQSSQGTLPIVDKLNSFCKTLVDAVLVSAMNLVTQRLETLRLKNVYQKVTDYFKDTIKALDNFKNCIYSESQFNTL